MKLCMLHWHRKMCMLHWHRKLCMLQWHRKLCMLHWHRKLCILHWHSKLFHVSKIMWRVSVPMCHSARIVTRWYATGRSREPCGLTRGSAPLDCWDHGFRSYWRHWCSPLVFVLCCVGSGLCDELITRYCVCISNCVWPRNLQKKAVLAWFWPNTTKINTLR